MKGVADRTLELMNEFQKEQYTKSYRDFQHFLVVKIEELEEENKVLKQLETEIRKMLTPDPNFKGTLPSWEPIKALLAETKEQEDG